MHLFNVLGGGLQRFIDKLVVLRMFLDVHCRYC